LRENTNTLLHLSSLYIKGRKNENSILLQPFNPNYEPLIFTYDEMKTIPVTIVGIVRQLKREF